jgi:hypothetical protein
MDVQDYLPYHVEGNHITERDLAGFVALDKMLIDQDGAASCGQAQHERPLSGRIEGFDTFYVRPLAGLTPA